ncbi:hypothetical protein KCP75_06325 [Salmonella enterica subsp. enterica]|nr:hypothetical protein KCP75_06325 [Salmonella enterica subsp. enterica]
MALPMPFLYLCCGEVADTLVYCFSFILTRFSLLAASGWYDPCAGARPHAKPFV